MSDDPQADARDALGQVISITQYAGIYSLTADMIGRCRPLVGPSDAERRLQEIRDAITEFEKIPDKWGWSPVPLLDAIKEIVGFTKDVE